MADIQSATVEIRRGKKKEKKERTRNVLVSKCCFVSENVVFVSEICILVVEERSVLEIYSFTFERR